MTAVPVLRMLSVALALAAVGLFVYTAACAPLRTPNYLGIRGLKRIRALRNDVLWAQIAPLLTWVGTRIDRFLSDNYRKRIDRMLTMAGDYRGLHPEELVALCIVSGVAGLTAGILYDMMRGGSAILVVVGAIIGTALPYHMITSLLSERCKRIEHGLPWVIDLLALALSAGLDFPGALRQVVSKSSNPDDPLIEELNFILQELQVGKTRKNALSEFMERVPISSVQEFVGTIIQAEERGTPLAQVLRIQAETSRQRRSVRAEEQASKAGLRLMLPLILLVVAVMILIVAPLALDMGSNL